MFLIGLYVLKARPGLYLYYTNTLTYINMNIKWYGQNFVDVKFETPKKLQFKSPSKMSQLSSTLSWKWNLHQGFGERANLYVMH